MPAAGREGDGRQRRWKRFGLGLLVGLAAAVLTLALWLPGALEDIEYRTWDWRVRIFATPGPATGDIALNLGSSVSQGVGKLFQSQTILNDGRYDRENIHPCLTCPFLIRRV